MSDVLDGDEIALALVGLLLLTMPAFAVVRRRSAARGQAMDADVARRPTSILLGYWVRDWLMWVIGPLERFFVRAGVSPTAFNIIGALFGLAAGVAYAQRNLALAGWMILLGGAADIFDGRIARARGIANRYGAFLDSTLDRFAEMFAFLGVVIFFQGDKWALLATAVALGASLLVSYARARGEGVGVNHKGGVMQRAERLVLLAVASLLDGSVTDALDWKTGTLLFWALVVMGVGAFGTAVYRTWAIARTLSRQA